MKTEPEVAQPAAPVAEAPVKTEAEHNINYDDEPRPYDPSVNEQMQDVKQDYNPGYNTGYNSYEQPEQRQQVRLKDDG
jgi:hypothetical protein